MNKIDLNIHDILKIRIVNPSKSIFNVLNEPFRYFASFAGTDPDIRVELGDFKEDIRDTVAVDHKYFVKEDSVFFRDAVGLAGWKAEIKGVEGPRCEIKMSYDRSNMIAFPGALYPDQVMYNYLLYPVLERYFLKKGCLFLHAGGCADGESGTVFAGRGGSGKTTLIMNLVRQGYQTMGDGWIILKKDEMYSFPTCLPFFDYRVDNLSDENLSLYHRFNVAKDLFRCAVGSHPVKDRARLKNLLILQAENRDEMEAESVADRDAAAEMLFANNRLEWKANLPYKHDISRFFDAYEYVYRPDRSAEYGNVFRQGLLDSLKDARIYKIRMPLKWRPEYADKIRRLIEA